MTVRVFSSFLFLWLFLILGSGCASGLVYNHCPDCTESCTSGYISPSVCSPLECPPGLCHNQPEQLQYETLKSIWNGADVPFEGTEEGGGVRRVESAGVSLTMESSRSSLDVTVSSWDCNEGVFVPLESLGVRGMGTWNWDVTGHFIQCSDEYKIAIEPEARITKYLILHESNLSVDYVIEGVQGQGRLFTYLSTDLPDNTIGKGEGFEATAVVECSGGDCGDVWVELQYAVGISGEFRTVPVGSGEVFYTWGNPYGLGKLGDNEQGRKEWAVSTNKSGSYYMRALAHSSTVEGAASSPVPVEVRVGSLSVSDVRFDPNPVELGSNTTFHADVSCEGYYCGNVDVYAKNGTSKIIPLPNYDDYFVLYDENPQERAMPGDSHYEISWVLEPRFPGEYNNIYVSADSDEDGVGSASGEPAENLAVTLPSYGYLDMEGANLHPGVISEGDASVLSGTVVCSGGSCGNVRAYAQRDGEDIPPSGMALTTPENPSQPVGCLVMEEGDRCDVSWDISGNEDGTYENIRILADSDIPEVYNKTSAAFTLIVERPLGDIHVDAYLEPSQINVTECSEVSGTLGCSDEYCGILTATLKYYEGEPIGDSGNLSTWDANPVICEYPPCGLSWSLLGNVGGLYETVVSVHSNEGTGNETGRMALFVNEPGTPPEPTVYISSIQDIQCPIGSAFIVSADVVCYGSECGETAVYLQHKDEIQQWHNLTSGTAISTPENLKTVYLGAADSETLEWTLNSTHDGTFEIRAVAESEFADVEFKYFLAEIIPPGVVEIEVLSPDYYPIQFFSRGDTMPLSILITDDGEPRAGLNPVASFSGSLYPTIALNDLGDGTYSGSIGIPPAAEGEYSIAFESGNVQEGVKIVVDPSLDVILNTDSGHYRIMDAMAISGTVLKKGTPTEAGIEMSLTCGGWGMNIYDIDSGPDGIFGHECRLPGDIPPGECNLEARATDDSGNEGSSSTEIEVSRSEFDIYDLAFLSPAEGHGFISGDDIDIRVRVLLGSIPVEHAEVSCTDAYGNFRILLNRSGQGEYSATTTAERDPEDNNLTLRCMAETADGFFGSGFVNILVRPELNIDVIEPRPESNETEMGEILHIILQVSYSDFGYMEDGSVLMSDGDESIALDYTRNGIYETYYSVPSQGEIGLAFLATDRSGNSEEHAISIKSVSHLNVNWPAVIMVLAGILILLSLWFANNTKKGKTVVKTVYKTVVKGPDRRTVLKNRIRDLDKEKRAIEKAKEDAEIEYYQRKLTEAEFKKMMENYEQELLKVEAEIQEFRSEMESLE